MNRAHARPVAGLRRRRGRACRLAAGFIAILVLVAGKARSEPVDAIEFNRDIRPILSENCYFCHGPDKKHREADLRLDIRDAAIASEAFLPGNPDESELIARINSQERSEQMPPPKSNKKLTAAQKELLRRWIAEGAGYQPHWAFVVPKRPAIPTPKRSTSKNPIDAFILKTLESKKIRPSTEADRRTLLRRLSLDLTGLPPTPEQVADFLADDDPQAYGRWADFFLDSPQFGERMATGWLDLVRFTDTVGYHGDQNQRIFPYRDYVINAFNKNKPFDQFTAEQLAGDLLPDPTSEQIVATGFNRLNMMTREGGAQPKEYLAKYAADRVRTVATTWLGSTLGCAECHDHKFDPFTARDFYRLEAFFADVKQWGVYNDYGYTPNPELKGFTNDYPFPPEIEVASPYLGRREQRLGQQIREVYAANAARLTADDRAKEAFDTWTETSLGVLEQWAGGWVVASPAIEAAPAARSRTVEGEADDEGGIPAKVIPQTDGSLLLTGKSIKGDMHRFRITPAAGWLASIRLEVLPHETHHGKVTRDGVGNTLIGLSAEFRPAGGGKGTPLAFAFADADHKEERYASGAEILGVQEGWKTSGRHSRETQTSAWRLARPIRLEEGDAIVVTVKSDNVGCLRLAFSPFGDEDPGRTGVDPLLGEALETAPGARTKEQADRLAAAYLLGTGWDAGALGQIQALQAERRECRGGRSFTMITRTMEPLTTRVLPRGNWQDESGEVVTPGVPEFLARSTESEGRRLTRLDLARWINAPENPLTARVFVNRLWKQFFGNGLSNVLDDLGAQGEWPTHLELLDWLAVEFRESGWDVKHMVRQIVMSATYRQDARQRPELHEIDPHNRLLAAQSPRRLEAELVRDNALAIAGLINLEVGGPSVYPYQPGGYYANLQFPDRDYVADRDERQYRRGVYMHWQRTFLQPMLANFDAPSREECTATRPVANTPQQALTLLNDPTFVEAARVLARDLLAAEAGSDRERIDALFRQALSRPAHAAERESLAAFLAAMRKTYQESPEDASKLLKVGFAPSTSVAGDPELAAWTSVCRVVLNLHETITRY
jgi:hypothetical protein